jgi:HSP20 family protein
MVLVKSKPESFVTDRYFPQSFHSLFNSFFDESNVKDSKFKFMPTAEIVEHENEFEIKLALPGIKKENVNISLDGEHLTIKGERKDVSKSENSKTLKSEISYGAFSRSFLVGKVDSSKIEASFEDGVLSVSVPKEVEAKASLIQIK